MANYELALPHFREAVTIYSAINIMDDANEALRAITTIEGNIRCVGIARAAAVLAAAAATAASRN